MRREHKFQPFWLCQQAGKIFQIGQEAGEIKRLIIQLHFTAFDFVHLNDIIKDVAQRDGRDVDGFQVFQLFLIKVGIQQNTAQANNAIKRRTKLVADRRDKGGLLPAGVL